MPYTELIRQEGEYNYSANIQFDIENDYKLGRFIPNETTVELLREYFVDISRDNPSQHSRILYGSYGTGKSHFLTVLSLLLGKMHTDGAAFEIFIERIKEFDENLAADIKNFVKNENRKPFLVVPVVFDFEDFERCLYFSLKKKLNNIGKNVSFKTFYDQALSLIEKWENNSESFDRLIVACQKAKIKIEALKQKLMLFNNDAEYLFQQVFSEMTYGVKYIYEVTNIADAINQVNEELNEEYAGVVFIFDEFGRYIEDNIKKIKVKSVQDLAEFCDHCAGNNHIILVSHKEIGQYTQKYGKSVANEWKKVEGRYKATPINDKQDQCLSLVRNVLIKNTEKWEQFKKDYQTELSNMYTEAADFKGFLIDIARGQNPFEGGFPLHPISLFALDKLSKKVAQNERTFFTYLASQDDNSLYHFLSKTSLDEFHFVGIDEIYDYFEPSIKAVQSDASYDWYKNLQSALSKNQSSTTDDTPEVKLLKVIATIGIINDASTLTANRSTLLSVVDCPREILSNALVGLCERRIIKYSGSYDRYDFYEASIFDVESMIEEESQQVQDEVVVHTLNEEFVDFALYPYKYNRDYKISRLFVPVFATPDTFLKKSLTSKLGQYYDGVLVMLLADVEINVDEICAQSKEIKRSIIFANRESELLKTTVKKYVAAKSLETKKAEYVKKDPSFEKELTYFKKELSTAIFSMIYSWRNNYGDEVFVVSEGVLKAKICSMETLSSLASEICKKTFDQTLIVNNELINKNSISGSISSAKKNVISRIIKGESAQDYYGAQYLSPDYIAVRSVLVKNGFVTEIEDVDQNLLPDNGQPQKSIKKALHEFITRAREEFVSFSDVYSTLKMPPYGLRDGYMSLLLAHILIPYKKSLIISSHDVEQELSTELFEEIIRRPEDYAFTIASWSSEQVDYLDALEQIFEDYINEVALSRNRMKAIYDGMLLHYKNVSKFARTTDEYVAIMTKRYRKEMEKSSTNYSNFFFKRLRGLGGDYTSTIDIVKKAKTDLEDALKSLAGDLANDICKMHNVDASMSLSSLFVQQYRENWQRKRQKSFDYYTNAFMEFASNVTEADHDYELILELSKVMTGFEILYWNDAHKVEFINQLKEVKAKLDVYGGTNILADHETRMTLVGADGKEQSVVFDRSELSALSKTLKNKITATFANYGLAVSYDDKVQILLALIEELLEGK